MRFIKTNSSEEVEKLLVGELTVAAKNNNNVTWMMTGGSNVNLIAAIFNKLSPDVLPKLTLMLSDERYGVYDHPDSNYAQLSARGIDFSNVSHIRVLNKENLSFEQTTKNYESAIEQQFKKTDMIFAQLGMGGDGHIAGILPGSTAAEVDDRLVTNYEAGPYKRITLTFKALRKINKAYLVTLDTSKATAIMNLYNGTLPLLEQPAQILREIADSYVINSTIGENI